MELLTLSGKEISTLRKCEAVIEKGLSTFREVGQALLQIKEQSLHRSDYTTFADYCEQRWNFTRQRAYQLIAAVKVGKECQQAVDKNSPSLQDEYASRELGKVSEEKRQEVLDAASEAVGDKPLTAKAIREAAETLDRKCPNCGSTEFDDDGDCAACHEPAVVEAPADPEPAPAKRMDLDQFYDHIVVWFDRHKKPEAVRRAMMESATQRF